MPDVPRPDPGHQVITLCAWCPDAAAKLAAATAAGHTVTHGICAACAKRVAEEDAE